MRYPPFIEAILRQHRIAFLIVSRDLRVLALGGAELAALGVAAPSVDLRLILPELEAIEAELQQIADGGAPALTLEHLGRLSAERAPAYFTVRVVPYSHEPPGAGLLVTISEATAEGMRYQELTQRTNEGLLLREQVARQNMELGAANMELRQLSELKSTFVAMTAHELRNPLTVALGYLDLLLETNIDAPPPEQRQMLTLVRGQLRRLSTISSELLDLAKIEAGRIDLHLRPADLELVARSVVSEHSAIAQTRQQHLLVESVSDLPVSLIDETRVAQVLSNLVSNASKFTPAGGIITVRLFPDERQGFVVVAVSDTGIGISPDDQARLFERFFRSSSARSIDLSGNGLGLFIARAFVELHGGRIWCVSAPQQGSTFYVSLPTMADTGGLLTLPSRASGMPFGDLV
jgi:signal transduction histidine kinase